MRTANTATTGTLATAAATAVRRALRGPRALALAALAAGAALAGCGDGLPQHGQPVARVLVIGVDGLEWSVLRPLIAAGRCPNLRGLMERGSFGRLATMQPTLSPVLWTSIATGRLPQDHGIRGFLDEQGRMYTSARRAVRALWNIADRYGLSSNVVGWWDTWPAEKGRGVMVTGASSAALLEENWKPALLPGVERQVEPVVLTDEVMALAGRAGSMDQVRALQARIFGPTEGVLDAAEQRQVQQSLWSLQADATFAAVAEYLLATRAADLNMVYLASPDVTGHRFWRPYEPQAYRWRGTPAADAALAAVIPNDYAWIDELVGRLMAAAGPDTAVIVLSDHGMHAVSTDAPPADGSLRSGHHFDAPPGVLIAAGPGIAAQGGLEKFLQGGVLPQRGSVLDVAPTVLALLGVPGSRALAGRAFTPLLAPGPAQDNARLPLVPSHDDGFRPPELLLPPPELEQDFLDRFRALGYVSAPSEPNEPRSEAPGEAAARDR